MKKELNLDEVYLTYNVYIRRVICNLVNNYYNKELPTIAPEIEDLESEVWIAITKELHKFNEERASLKTYLCLVAKSTVNALYRKDNNNKNKAFKQSYRIEGFAEEGQTLNLYDVLEAEENTDLEYHYMLKEILDCLSVEERRYFNLHILGGVSLKELNKILEWNVAETSLNTKSSRILNKIRKKVLETLEKSISI